MRGCESITYLAAPFHASWLGTTRVTSELKNLESQCSADMSQSISLAAFVTEKSINSEFIEEARANGLSFWNEIHHHGRCK